MTGVDTRGKPSATAEPSRLGNVLARAAAVTAGLTLAGALFGLVRDQAIAQIYGASVDSDAFLISWTVPEMAATLLIEDAMALLLVPAFSHALARRAAAAGEPDGGALRGDPVRALVRHTFPKLFAVLAAATGLLLVFAPQFVAALAPGFADPALAVECTRLTALTVLTFGIAGYFSAALRAHGCFVPPAGVYVAYNAGIIATTIALHGLWGVRAAAAGVAFGGALMVLVQLPFFAREVTTRPRRPHPLPRPRTGARTGRFRGVRPLGASGAELPDRPATAHGGRTAPGPNGTHPEPEGPHRAEPGTPPAGPAGPAGAVGVLLAPIVLFAVSRQSQVLVERFLASSLPSGAISHLNYAQKVAQMPMVLSLMFCTVTFPAVAKAMAEGDRERARRRVENDLALAGLTVLLGTALIIGYAPQIVEVLFQRGAFGPEDTQTTATVMRVYAAGLLGHTLVGALGRPFFSAGRPTWYPAVAMAAGLVVTVAAGAAAVGPWGVYGIAAANAAGISTTALLLLRGLGSRVVPIRVRAITPALGRLALAAGCAAAAGRLAAGTIEAALPSLAVGCLLVPAVFTVTGLAVRAPEVVHLLALIRQRIARHVR
ncbi:virulence factor MviN [Streptomyces sp. SID5473]|uniref:Virulence factor MviN n=2 Tax=Streptomyces tsukubensis TaxID=83656 RepID=A0A7G3UPN8_STRT9|nr:MULTISPECIES: lipid II flippase MurJ [Streptomyces]AZK98582.1 virulence factor MviN [Streptomyces tsukubensis]MYS68632.1 virulence factor MviN [Streptomyces sp. SID5473]QKM71551.1 virulence factor MviN [Streptomyces tsukubensis NRRL18488]TAI44665.1 virulence factor MviN [Streptomyces tsukubensis]